MIELLEKLITSTLTSSINRRSENNTEANGDANAPETCGAGLKTTLRFFQTIFSNPEERWDDSYKMHIEKKLNRNQQTAQSDDAQGTTLHFWCFNPEIRYV